MVNNKPMNHPIKKSKYSCIFCDYSCDIKSDYNKHLMTKKHNTAVMASKNTNVDCFYCKCGKKYKHMSSLSKHKSKCSTYKDFFTNRESLMETPKIVVYSESNEKKDIQNEIITELIEQNHELKQLLLEERSIIDEERENMKTRFNENKIFYEEIKNIFQEQTEKIEKLSKQTTVINNNNFNLNIFLNEKCKNAMTLIDFVESLQIDTCNVEYTGKHGYVEGITKIFFDGLKQLDVYQRPIHCTDLKRETLYIKEEANWEKDNLEKTKFKKALGTVVKKNIQQIKKWQQENPNCNIMNSLEYELHLNIMRQSLGGGNQEKTDKNNNKIIRNIVKEVIIDKTKY
jgi:hypothetical protein